MYSTTIGLCAVSSFACADITVKFEESAPKDRFVISSSTCAVEQLDIAIDLSPSAGALIFDVTVDGAGVEVFQPVEIQTGNAQAAPVVDGDQFLRLTIPELPAGTEIIVSADLDDVLPQSSLGQIRVTGSELDGASIQLTLAGQTYTSVFSDGANRVSFPNACTS